MATIRGRITDFGGAQLLGLHPEFTVIPEAESSFGTQMLTTRPIPVTLDEDDAFEFDVISSDEMRPPRSYTFRVIWLDPAGRMAAEDRWRNVWVPLGTWDIPDLIGSGAVSSTHVFWQATEPDPFPLYAYWVNTINGDVYQRTA